ncbi:hypothetical protein M2650_13795 [Luteimonas sp. SX5]|uniref:Cytochrome c domain-containing protein n=1 Tax=Luteimonas galliterrae TaxID=2940486 RepID=A0ABT0MLD3_9GAMM|nr:hypothetical protein [Luteimonas galliterrae]MCL1635697.1 hypothetical protein [Luteimonas galliterrae]
MDRGGETRRFLTGALLAAACASALAAAATQAPLRAARWLPPERRLPALAQAPSECLAPNDDPQTARRIAIGRAAFRTPLLLGGQAARAGLSCDSCHRNGRGNPDFSFAGLSGAPGTADVTSSLMSSHRGDGVDNPTAIPDLAGPAQTLKVPKAREGRALETFVRGLIVQEFDGPEPAALTLDGIAEYVRAVSSQACPPAQSQPIALATYLSDARAAAQAAQYALDARDPATAHLMLSAARTALGMIDERYAAPEFARERRFLRDADLELAALQHAVGAGRPDAASRIAAWLARMPRWGDPLRDREPESLFDRTRLAAALGGASAARSPGE